MLIIFFGFLVLKLKLGIIVLTRLPAGFFFFTFIMVKALYGTLWNYFIKIFIIFYMELLYASNTFNNFDKKYIVYLKILRVQLTITTHKNH